MQEREPVDIFQWANKIDGIKRELDVEFFLFNKNYTPYSTNLGGTIEPSVVQPLFLYSLINDVMLGAGNGLTVREVTYAETDVNVLRRADIKDVGRAETLIHLIENERSDIVEFNEAEHEFKRVKGIVARFTHKSDRSIKFYVVKAIPQAATLTGQVAWGISSGRFNMLNEDVAFKVPADNQVLIVDGDIFAFNPSKFESLFGYDARKIAIVEQKGKEIEEHYRLSFDGTIGLDLAYLTRQSKTLINKMQTIDPERFTQDEVIEIIEEMQLELMTDDTNKIIIMDSNDLMTFLMIINDDYVRGVGSNATYLAKNKKPLEIDDEQS